MAQATALGIRRFFTKAGKHPYDEFTWMKRDSSIVNPITNKPVFEQKQVEFPDTWSQNAINIVAQKYFFGTLNSKEREKSLKQLIDRVVDTITKHGIKERYFVDETEAETFSDELKFILTSQRAAFNSPVWFNIGAAGREQQASACFILKVEDEMPSILNWYKEEGMIFKGGSGSGINLSTLRSSYEALRKSAGTASGPLSFMRGADASAGAIKSGGKTRRAAKMVILNIYHPDIEDFIWCKAIEERKARVLQEAGYDMDLDGKDSFSVQYQNANNSVRVTDEFMEAVENNDDWQLKAITTGRVIKTVKARDIMRQISEAAWECADPGMQFDTVINKWHTTPNAGRINASNPCSEYMHLDNSACNLASINLLKYLNEDGTFDIEAYKHTIEVVFTAQEILVGYSTYPTESIAKTARTYRQLGLGYANLGAMLMAKGLPYDSEEGRAIAASVTALMTGTAYATSAKLARRVGSFAGFDKDREGVLRVLRQHRQAIAEINPTLVPEDLLSAAASAWDEAIEQGTIHGIRNSQATVLAPTGTIGFMMDCDTTGIEPDLGLVKIKKLVGGGTMNIVNQTVPRALKQLGYSKDQIQDIVSYIDKEKTILGAPHLMDDHVDVFACSMGDNAIHYGGHVTMMAAVQPFISGAISKTVNMPENVTVEDVEQLHIDAWKLGLKAVAIYRDNCKVAQPLAMAKKESQSEKPVSIETAKVQEDTEKFVYKGAVRRKLPRQRKSKTYEFHVADCKGFFTVGEFEDGTPGELFIRVAKQGSTLAGVMDSFAISVSHGLQFGVPLKNFAKTFLNWTYAPSGLTDDPEIRTASSLTDYIFRRLAKDYLPFEDQLELGMVNINDQQNQIQTSLIKDEKIESSEEAVKTDSVDKQAMQETTKPEPKISSESLIKDKAATKKSNTNVDTSAPLCYNCGNKTVRAGACYVCTACGTSTGCG